MSSDGTAHPPAHEPRDMVRVLYNLVDGVSRAPSAEAIYDQALTALMSSVMPDRDRLLLGPEAVPKSCMHPETW